MRCFLLWFLYFFSVLNLNAQSKNDLRLEIDRLKTDSIQLSTLIANQAERIEGLQEYGSKLLSDNNRLIRDSLHMDRKIEEFESSLGKAAVEIQNLRILNSNLKLENNSLRVENLRLTSENERLSSSVTDSFTEIHLFIDYMGFTDKYSVDIEKDWYEVDIKPRSEVTVCYGGQFKMLIRGWGENEIRVQIERGTSEIVYNDWVQLERGEWKTIFTDDFSCIPCYVRDADCEVDVIDDFHVSYFHGNGEFYFDHYIRATLCGE